MNYRDVVARIHRFERAVREHETAQTNRQIKIQYHASKTELLNAVFKYGEGVKSE